MSNKSIVDEALEKSLQELSDLMPEVAAPLIRAVRGVDTLTAYYREELARTKNQLRHLRRAYLRACELPKPGDQVLYYGQRRLVTGYAATRDKYGLRFLELDPLPGESPTGYLAVPLERVEVLPR